MNNPAVNLGAGGFVSYMEDGGAAVTLPEMVEEPQYDERGVGAFLAEQYTPFADPATQFDAAKQTEIRMSATPGSEARDVYYPEGPTFYETLQQDFNYPLVQDPLDGPNRFERPPGREDMPTPQELADTRAHMLGTAMISADYGPETALRIGNIKEDFGGSNRLHRAMDKRNNAVGASIFKQAGIQATPAQLAQMVDNRIFQQLNTILGRPEGERSLSSPDEGPDVYFPRDDYGYFISDY